MTLKRATGSADHTSMETAPRSISDERGFTLVELLVAAFILVVGMAGAFALLNGANRATTTNNARMGATNLARELLEDARSVDYDSLKPATMDTALKDKSGTSGTPWKVTRRGIDFTVTTEVCTFDDPKDNIATTPPDNVCTPQAPVPAAAGTLDPEIQPDDFRRVTIRVAWNTGDRARSIKQVSLINNPSGGLGPRLTRFDPHVIAADGSAGQVGSGVTAAVFPTTTTIAGSVRWNSDGTPNGSGDSTGGPTTWNTTWQLGSQAAAKDPTTANWSTTQYTSATVLDGTYTVTAQPFDDRGIAGDSRAAVLPLNRSFPITVTGLEIGRNFNYDPVKVEARWNANPENDIIGYRVYDLGSDNTLQGYGGGNDTLLCSTASVQVTSCTGLAPSLGNNPTYAVVALDRTIINDSSTAIRESPYGEGVQVSSTVPGTPFGLLTLPDLATLKPKLSWSHPNTASVRYYRIYRDTCCTPADRYDETANGTTTTYVDTAAPAGLHRYWVTAVGPGISESPPSNSSDMVAP